MDSVKTIESKDEGKTYEIPESCIGSAQDARDTIANLVKAEEGRSRRRAKVDGMLNGNPPWPGLLKDKGQGERANFGQREGEGFVAAAKTPYYALFFKNERFIQLTLDYGSADATQLATWAGKIGTRYQYANEDDDSLDMHVQASQFQMVVHGNGPMVWEDDKDWRSKFRMAGQILVPDDASADIDEWDTVACPRSYLPTELWNKVKKVADSDRRWNVEAVKRAIMKASSEDYQTRWGTQWEFYEAQMRKGATGWNAKSKRIFVHDLLQKEFSGKISHFIVLKEDAPPGSIPPVEKSSDPLKGFLFRQIGRYDEWGQIICPFTYDVGPDLQWHSIKGAGPKIFDFFSVSDRLTCRSLDGAMKAAGIVVKAADGKALQESAFTDVAGGTVVGPGYEVQQQRVVPDLQSPLLMKRDLQSTLQSNTGQYRQRVSEDNQEPTLGQAQLNVQQQSVLGEGDAARYCKYLDRFHRERFRRILLMGERLYSKKKLKLAPDAATAETGDDKRNLTPSEKGALKFYSGCIEDGVPEQILKFENFCRIRATRLVGNGSSQMRQMISEKLVSLAGAMDERGRNFTFRALVSAVADETWADATFPAYDTPQIVDSHMSLAQLENNFLRIPGGKVLVDPSQDHVIHFDSHLADVGDDAKTVESGQADPHALLIHLEQAGPHMGEHLKAIANDPTRKDQVDQMQKAWLGISKMSDQLAQQIQEADAAAAKNQPQQAPDPALIAALTKVHGELGIKQAKARGEMQLKAEKQAFTLREKDITTAHKMRLSNLEAAQQQRESDAQIANQKVAA